MKKRILDMLSEERIEYASSIVLGLNDALVELTGALAGLTFALKNGNIIALTGFIIGFAAALSMAASGYLSSREESRKSPLKGAFYTGIAYLITVLLLITPYFLFKNVYIALIVMILFTLFIIAFYTFYITTAKNLKFWRRFFEMVLISLSVAVISFLIGIILRTYFVIEV